MMVDLKIICTLGPKSAHFNVLQAMVQAGMDMVRINTAHGELSEYLSLLSLVSRVEAEREVVLKRLLDLKGIDLRLGSFSGVFPLNTGDCFSLVSQGGSCPEKGLFPFSHPDVLDTISLGERLCFDSGCLKTEVVLAEKNRICVQAKNRWTLRERKGVTVPSFIGTERLELTSQDLEALTLCSKERIDWIALSFVNHPTQVKELRDWLKKNGHPFIKIMSKIETKTGMDRLEEIISESDAVMFARGDLGTQLNIEYLPRLQKYFFSLSNKKGVPAVLATQLLSSMCNRLIPNRSEVTDVFNGVLDGASGLMLSEESAVGDFPVETVSVLRKLIEEGKNFIKEKNLPFLRALLE